MTVHDKICWVAGMMLMLAACGSSGDSKATESAPAADSPRTARERARTQPPATADRPRPSLDVSDTAADDDDDDDDEAPSEREVVASERMAEFDRDGDGALDTRERSAMRESRLQNLLQSVDANGDGRLTLDEMQRGDDMRGKRMARQFSRLDADGDGALSRQELDAMLESRGKRGPWSGKGSGRPAPEGSGKRKLNIKPAD